jgi:hypothetical protein
MSVRQALGIGIMFVALGVAFQPNHTSTQAQCYVTAAGDTVCLPRRIVTLPRVARLAPVVTAVPAVTEQVVTTTTTESAELRVGGTDTDGAVIVSVGSVAAVPVVRQGLVTYPVGSVGASRVQYVRGTPLMWRGPVRRLLCRLWGR